MSILGAAQVALAVVSDFVLITPLRSIGSFTANVTISERHNDELEITQHPVEQGASIADHAFKRPARVLIECGYSNSGFDAGFDPNYVKEQYNNFLNLQASRQPFQITTGKRLYTNMLIRSLDCTTDHKTENALLLRVDCQQILIAQTQVVTIPDSSVMANPQKTGATQNTGTQQLAPGTNFNAGAAAGL